MPVLTREQILRIVYPPGADMDGRRYTQDTPVLPDVWAEFGADIAKPRRLLLTPNARARQPIPDLVQSVRRGLAQERGADHRLIRVAYNESHVMVEMTFEELLRVAIPLSVWWHRDIVTLGPAVFRLIDSLPRREHFVDLMLSPSEERARDGLRRDLLNLVRIAGALSLSEPMPEGRNDQAAYFTRAVKSFSGILSKLTPEYLDPPHGWQPPLWAVFLNRPLETAVTESRRAVKADAATQLFAIRCNDLRWAVIDSGIDARHPAFADSSLGKVKPSPATSRVDRTLDFTRIEKIMMGGLREFVKANPAYFADWTPDEIDEFEEDLDKQLMDGRPVDWKLLTPLLEIPHDKGYQQPRHAHGTHVAGILAGADGICPEMRMLDLRVVQDDGKGDEFSVLAALQFVRHLNQGRDLMQVHGANLSLQMRHQVDSFACGSTPVCEEANRTVAAGVVVVAAAGNLGYDGHIYRMATITDPGNADDVITVGATHRISPHKYGVSYFSSRGPTGDGRLKPDLVAPGEKIQSAAPGGESATLDGTSMAAPHVSGGAALLMARHREFIGNPRRVKQILCSTATDLGRERYFQGAGMLDVLRALQSV